MYINNQGQKCDGDHKDAMVEAGHCVEEVLRTPTIRFIYFEIRLSDRTYVLKSPNICGGYLKIA